MSLVAAGIAFLWFSPILGGSLPDSNIVFNPESLETKAVQPSITITEPETTPKAPLIETKPPFLTTQKIITPSADLEEKLSLEAYPPRGIHSQPMPTSECKGLEAVTLLVVGLDERIQADAIRLVRVNFVNSSVQVLSIPRDFYVPIIDMGAYSITEGRINATYGYGETLLGKGKGITSLMDNLTYNFGVSFDHYLVLNLKEIATYIDKIGGVVIHLDQAVSDGWSNFSSGDHHFDGETALIFMRMRLFDDDFARVRRQTMVLKAFFKKTITDLNTIEQTQMAFKVIMDKTIQTDLTLRDINPLICLAQSIEATDVTFFEVEKSMYRSHTTASGANALIPIDTVVPYIQSIMGGYYRP